MQLGNSGCFDIIETNSAKFKTTCHSNSDSACSCSLLLAAGFPGPLCCCWENYTEITCFRPFNKTSRNMYFSGIFLCGTCNLNFMFFQVLLREHTVGTSGFSKPRKTCNLNYTSIHTFLIEPFR